MAGKITSTYEPTQCRVWQKYVSAHGISPPPIAWHLSLHRNASPNHRSISSDAANIQSAKRIKQNPRAVNFNTLIAPLTTSCSHSTKRFHFAAFADLQLLATCQTSSRFCLSNTTDIAVKYACQAQFTCLSTIAFSWSPLPNSAMLCCRHVSAIIYSLAINARDSSHQSFSLLNFVVPTCHFGHNNHPSYVTTQSWKLHFNFNLQITAIHLTQWKNIWNRDKQTQQTHLITPFQHNHWT